MGLEQSLIHALADTIASAVVRSVQATLQVSPAKSTYPGDDVGIMNLWEEVCAQVHRVESDSRQLSEAYKTCVVLTESFLEEVLNRLERSEKLTLWLQTGSGWSWGKTHGENENIYLDAPVAVKDILSDLLLERMFSVVRQFQGVPTWVSDPNYDPNEESNDKSVMDVDGDNNYFA